MATPTGPPLTTIIHARGDVILKLNEGDSTTRLLVSSQTLALASTVFEAMFNGKFAEGQGLSANSPPEVELPDDNPTLMTILCNIAHLRASDVPKELSVLDLADFAILCDKYACIGAVYSWIRFWIQEPLSKPDEPDFEKLILVTYLMDLPQEFSKVTQYLIRDRAACFDPEVASHGHEFLPSKFLYGLLKAHTVCQSKARQAFNVSYKINDCNASLEIAGKYLRALTVAKLCPVTDISISQARDQAKMMEEIANAPWSSYHRDCFCQRGSLLKNRAIDLMNMVYNEAKGFCLDCVKRQEGMKTGECRVQHT
jgi:hypothetical protein